MEDIKVLKRFPLFNNLGAMDLVEVAKVVHSRRVAAGEAVITEGEGGGAFYVVKSGTAVVFISGEDEKKRTLGRFQPGDSFGEISLIDEGPRSATVEAEVEVELLEVKREDFHKLLSAEDSLAHALMHNLLHDLCDKLRRTNHYLLLSE